MRVIDSGSSLTSFILLFATPLPPRSFSLPLREASTLPANVPPAKLTGFDITGTHELHFPAASASSS